MLHIIPRTFFDAFTGSGDLLQVLFVAILFGYAMTHLGTEGGAVHQFIEDVLARLLRDDERAHEAGAARRRRRDGVHDRPLRHRCAQAAGALMGSFYLTCLLFVLVVLGSIAAFTGFSILRFIGYIKDELLTVLGTSSSESALVPLMQKLERLGCSKSVVGLVVPSGYSFNLDGTNIYLTMAAMFVAQALNIDLTLRQQLTLLGVAMLTSKGASGVTGRRLHHAGRHTGRGAVDSRRGARADPGRGPLHVGSALDHELHRQRRGGDRRVALGERARR